MYNSVHLKNISLLALNENEKIINILDFMYKLTNKINCLNYFKKKNFLSINKIL